MDRVFLDANILFSAAYLPESGLHRLWKLNIELITSSYAVEEALSNLETEDQRARLYRLTKSLRVIRKYTEQDLPNGISLPDKDRPILFGAIAAKATHLLTGDKTHFGPYYDKIISDVLILPPGDYLRAKLK